MDKAVSVSVAEQLVELNQAFELQAELPEALELGASKLEGTKLKSTNFEAPEFNSSPGPIAQADIAPHQLRPGL